MKFEAFRGSHPFVSHVRCLAIFSGHLNSNKQFSRQSLRVFLKFCNCFCVLGREVCFRFLLETCRPNFKNIPVFYTLFYDAGRKDTRIFGQSTPDFGQFCDTGHPNLTNFVRKDGRILPILWKKDTLILPIFVRKDTRILPNFWGNDVSKGLNQLSFRHVCFSKPFFWKR